MAPLKRGQASVHLEVKDAFGGGDLEVLEGHGSGVFSDLAGGLLDAAESIECLVQNGGGGG